MFSIDNVLSSTTKWCEMFKKSRPKNAITTQSSGNCGENHLYENNNQLASMHHGTNHHNREPSPPPPPVRRPQLVFHCQLAHGSPTGFISGFSNVKQLYEKVAENYDFPVSEILFCTLNTHKVDMKCLLGGQIGLEDFIFAHKKGRPKEIELVKTDDALGLTITDNGAGYAFIKRVKEGSIVDKLSHIQVGDHIEKLNGELMVGKRHFEVAKILTEIEKGSTFTIRLVEPLKSGFSHVGTKSKKAPKSNYGTGRETLRFKADGNAEIEQRDDVMDTGIEKINIILENFLGINDSELASQIWEKGQCKENSMDFAEAIDDSDLEVFGFNDDLIIELWGAITDARARR